MRDLGSFIKALLGITTAAKTDGTALSAAIDLASYDGFCAILHTGTWTDGTHTPSITECDTSGGTYTAVATADLIGAFTAVTSNANVGAKQKVGYIGKKRYIKLQIVTTGSTTGAVLGMDAILGFARKEPLT